MTKTRKTQKSRPESLVLNLVNEGSIDTSTEMRMKQKKKKDETITYMNTCKQGISTAIIVVNAG